MLTTYHTVKSNTYEKNLNELFYLLTAFQFEYKHIKFLGEFVLIEESEIYFMKLTSSCK
jgi:hypothetical protein